MHSIDLYTSSKYGLGMNQVWLNFVKAQDDQTIMNLVKELALCGGKLNNGTLRIEFQSTTDYYWFLLKWS